MLINIFVSCPGSNSPEEIRMAAENARGCTFAAGGVQF